VYLPDNTVSRRKISVLLLWGPSDTESYRNIPRETRYYKVILRSVRVTIFAVEKQ